MQFLEISLCLSLITYRINTKIINKQKLFKREKNFDKVLFAVRYK